MKGPAMNARLVTLVFLLGLLVGGATVPVAAQAIRSVLLSVGTVQSPTALTATNGALNVNCQ